jgi:polysaccharide export outer membrane protein
LFIAVLSLAMQSCTTTKEVRYLQPSASLTINEEGLVPYNKQEYRITKNDILMLNIVTTPKGDAAQFYSKFSTTGGEDAGGGVTTGTAGATGATGGTGAGASRNDSRFYFNGLRVNSKGNIDIFGIGEIKAEGRTLEDISAEVQQRVNENFLEGKSQVHLDIDGITYYILGDIETTQLTGKKKAYKNSINILEAIAENGGLNRTIDRKNITIQRYYPEGIKIAKLDLTKEDAMNSPYFWLQNGDIILLNTKAKSMYGFGKDPLQALTTGVSLMTTALSIYLLLTKL